MTTTLTDDYGRRVVFEGEHLIAETTDTSDARKPQWLEIDIWRTAGGSYVVRRSSRYRVVHARESCGRAEGYDLELGSATHPCPVCNPDGALTGFVQLARVTVEVHKSPEDLIESLRVDGRHSRFSRSILADLSECDTQVDALWNEVRVP